MRERQTQILNLLGNQKRIRKDLATLEEKGL